MPISFPIQKAARIIRGGGVVAYPTEGIFGLGCLPADQRAVERILAIKQRDPSLGLILLAGNAAQLEPWIDGSFDLPASEAAPITWIVPASPAVPPWIRGDHTGVAVRISSHPIAVALCEASASALVSTSANISGRKPTTSVHTLRRQFHTLVDYIVPGQCGPASGSSEIRNLVSGKTLRPAGQ